MDMLKLYRGEHLLAEVALTERPLELGRGHACDLVVDDPELAERHGLVMRQLGVVVVYELAGAGRSRPRALPLGRRLSLGRHHELIRERAACTRDAGGSWRAGVVRDTESVLLRGRPRGERFVVVGRGRDARKLRIGDRPIHVGRGEHNDLVLVDCAASRLHCRLEPAGNELIVRDLGSRNGTLVNGVRVERAIVYPGARIGIGRSELYLVERDAEPDRRGARLIAESASMLAVLAEARHAAGLAWPALIVGESGSGKEGIAGLLHEQSPRRARPFVAINAGGVPADLVETELFGHERGAFTGASAVRRGVFEQAHGGTLFLDEIGELPLALQARLLRVLETGEIRRVGAEAARVVDVRVVCATHRDLRAMVAAGRFRQDLYFRLARVVIEVPPLRARPDDIRAIARHVLRELEPVAGVCGLTNQALEHLCTYPWPGNVRELRNVLAAAAVAGQGRTIERIDLERVLERMGGHDPAGRAPGKLLRETVVRHQGNLSAAARELGMARSTLRYRLTHAG